MNRRSFLIEMGAGMFVLGGCNALPQTPLRQTPTQTLEEEYKAKPVAIQIQNEHDSAHTATVDVDSRVVDPGEAYFIQRYTLGPNSTVGIPEAFTAHPKIRDRVVFDPQFDSDLQYPKREEKTATAGGWPPNQEIVIAITESGSGIIRDTGDNWSVQNPTPTTTATE